MFNLDVIMFVVISIIFLFFTFRSEENKMNDYELEVMYDIISVLRLFEGPLEPYKILRAIEITGSIDKFKAIDFYISKLIDFGYVKKNGDKYILTKKGLMVTEKEFMSNFNYEVRA